MFGNRLGWGISGAMAFVILLLVYYIGVINRVSEPSKGMVVKSAKISLNLETHPEFLEPIKLPVDPLTVLPSMTDSSDSAPVYRRAMAEYDKDRWAYEPDSRTGMLKSEDPAKMPAIAAAMEAVKSNRMNLFTSNAAAVLNYDQQPPDIEKLKKIGSACNLLGLMVKGTNKDLAVKLHEAAFSLGYKMVAERVRWAEFEGGWSMMMSSAIAIERADPARAAAKTFADESAKYYSSTLKPLWAVIGAIDPGIVGRTAGDVFYMVKNSKERMWRVEALLKLGRYRFDVGEEGRGADQRWAGLWAKRIANDENEDPIVREAARKARDLTIEEYRMIH